MLEPSLSETDRLVETRKLAEALTMGEVSMTQVAGRIVEKIPKASQIQLLIDQVYHPDPDGNHERMPRRARSILGDIELSACNLSNKP